MINKLIKLIEGNVTNTPDEDIQGVLKLIQDNDLDVTVIIYSLKSIGSWNFNHLRMIVELLIHEIDNDLNEESILQEEYKDALSLIESARIEISKKNKKRNNYKLK